MSTITGNVPLSSGTPSFSLQPVQFHSRRGVDLSLIDVSYLQKENEKIVSEVRLLSGQLSSIGSSIEDASREINEVQHKTEGIAGKTFDNTQTILRNQKESHQKLDTTRQEISSVSKGLTEVLQRQNLVDNTLSQLVTSHNGLVEVFKSSQDHQKSTDEKLDQILVALQSR